MSLNFEDYFDLNEKWDDDDSDDDDEVNEEHCRDTLLNEENSENIQISEPIEAIRPNVVQEAVALFDNDVGGDTEIIRPEVGMTFPSGEEFAAFVYSYAYKSGFEISIRTDEVKPEFKEKGINRKCSGDKEPQFFMMKRIRLVCTKACEEKRKADDSEFTDCKVVIDARFLKGKSHMEITICRLQHNHVIHPENRRFMLSYRHISGYFKRRALINDAAGISIIKSFNSMVLEAGGHENLPFNSRDLRNAVNLERRRSRLCGDAVAMEQYFEKMKLDNSDFFYAIERDIEGRLLNVFWADARCRSLFKSFSEVVSYDSTFGSNRFAMPFTPFVGVNHHGKSTLFAAALISHEDTVSYTWVFEKWIECMGKPPSVIITDQCKAIGNAVKKVFPNTLHRLCLWHIMQNAQRNLGSCTNWKKIDEDLRKTLHDSVDKYEFEDAWKEMVLKYKLEKNSWINDSYAIRDKWVPAYWRGTFCAGMSSTQRSEQQNRFFKQHMSRESGLRLFITQFENALKIKVEEEKVLHYQCIEKPLKLIGSLPVEEVFHKVYTNNIFRLVQEEVHGLIYTSMITVSNFGTCNLYTVSETIVDPPWRKGQKIYEVRIDESKVDFSCSCKLFEFKGILCRHVMRCIQVEDIKYIPDKYILDRWRKDLVRGYESLTLSRHFHHFSHKQT